MKKILFLFLTMPSITVAFGINPLHAELLQSTRMWLQTRNISFLSPQKKATLLYEWELYKNGTHKKLTHLKSNPPGYYSNAGDMYLHAYWMVRNSKELLPFIERHLETAKQINDQKQIIILSQKKNQLTKDITHFERKRSDFKINYAHKIIDDLAEKLD